MINLEEIVEPDDVNVENIKINNELNPDIFDGNKMKKNVREKLLKIAKLWKEYCKIPNNIEVKDVLLIGSNANYNYSQQSDIDIHIVIDYQEMGGNMEMVNEYFKAKKYLWTEEFDIKIKEYEVETYVQDVTEEPTSSGIYSILNDKWNVKPIKEMIVLDKKKIQEKSSKIINQIEKLEENPSVEKIEKLKEKIKKMRQSGLEKGGEYSIENLTFKVLRNNGYLEKLDNIKKDEISKEYSIEEDTEYELSEEQIKKIVKEMIKRKNMNYPKQ